jgi:nicotinate-nucleotide adenylyltransferase
VIVGILGGTFDPPHFGHLGMAVNVLSTRQVGEIWFVPCLTHRFGKAPAPFADRMAMCRLLISGQEKMCVSEVEAELNRPGYTLALVKRLMADHPGHTFRLVAGQDIYHQRDKWHHYDEIAAIAPPIYVARVGEPPIPEPTVPAPPDVSSSELREMIASRTPVDGLLPKTIIQYIEAHHLYVDASDD